MAHFDFWVQIYKM